MGTGRSFGGDIPKVGPGKGWYVNKEGKTSRYLEG